MTSLAAQERPLLCAAAEELGPDAPTLCAGWSVRDLIAHLVVRERHPATLGIVIPALAGTLQRVMDRQAQEPFDVLVDILRQGPPRWSPLGWPKLRDLANTLEFFVHHEDVRRAQPGWHRRPLTPATEDELWRGLGFAGRGLVRNAPVGVTGERSDTGERRRLRTSSPEVVVIGAPSEVVMFLYNRKDQAQVELLGDAVAVEALRSAALGV